MADLGDKIIYEATLPQSTAIVKKMAADLLEVAQGMRATGNIAEAEVKEAQAAMYTQMAVSPAKVAAGTEALQKQRNTMGEIRQEQLFLLDDLERENALYEQRAVVLDRLEARHRAYAGQQQALFGPEPAPLRERILGERPAAAPALSPQWRQQADEERRAEQQINAERQKRIELNQRLAQQDAYRAEVANQLARGERIGGAAASRGYLVPEGARQSLIAGPQQNPMWGVAQQQQMRLNIATGEYKALARDASIGVERLSANFTRLGMVEAESSNALRRHGALTTEYLQSLARGESTVSEFGYQIGATIGKFAGWTAAATLVYGALGALGEFTHGARDASSAAQQLQRTIPGVNANTAIKAINDLSTATNVSVKESGDAIFQYSRVFHDLGGATDAAHQGLAVLKLDNVSLADSVALSTGVQQQWGKTAEQQLPIWNMLAAGQREYNARISQTTTIIRGTQAAVRAAGGDLNQLVQLAVVGAERLPGAPGQIATALSRSATTYARQNLGQIQAQFGIGRGMTQQTYNFTKLFDEAIRLSGSGRLDANSLDQLRRLFFDQRLAARVGAAYLSPQGAAGLAGAQANITPGKTEGALYEELGRQMKTFHERMKEVTNEVQRAGASFGASGIVNIFSGLIDGGAHVAQSMRGLVDTFDLMPNTIKEMVEGLIAARVAFMALTRTRFGASILDAAGLADSPLLRGRARSTLDRGELRVGTRAALDTVTGDLTRTNTALLANAEQMRVLKERQVIVDEQIGAAQAKNLEVDAARLEESNALGIRIKGLLAEQTELEAQRVAQEKVQLGLKGQALGLSATNRDYRFSPAEVDVLTRQTGGGAVGRTTRGEVQAAAAEQKASLAEAASGAQGAARTQTASLFSQAGMQARWTAAQQRMAGAWAGLASAEGTSAGATARATVAAGATTATQSALVTRVLAYTAVEDEAAAAATVGAAAMTEATVAGGGFLAGLGGLAAAIDPFLLVLLALPFGISEVVKRVHQTSQAGKNVHDDLTRQYSGDVVEQLRTMARTHQEDVRKHATIGIRGALHWIGSSGEHGISGDPVTGSNAMTDAGNRLANQYDALIKQFQGDAKALTRPNASRKRLTGELIRLELAAAVDTGTALAGHPQMRAMYMDRFSAQIQDITQAAQQKSATTMPTQLDFLAGLSDAGLQGWGQAYSAKAGVFGLKGGDLSGAIGATMVMAARYRNSSDPKQLQALQTSISTVTQVVGKNADAWIAAAKTAPSAAAADADLGKAQGGLNRARQQVRHWIDLLRATWGKVPGGMAAVNTIAQDIFNQLDSYQSNILSQSLSQIQSQSDLAASQVSGWSPEANITRAQISLAGLTKQHATALKGGDWQKASDLQTQINNSQRDIAQQQYQNAQGVADTNAQIAAARILPISPEAQIKIAKIALDRARQKLAEDRANNVGAKQQADDYLAMLTDQNSVTTAERDNADQLFAAYQTLSISRITGVGPAADTARARQTLSNAWAKLRHDDALHKGQVAHVQDYAAALDAQRALNQQMVSNAQTMASNAASLISAQASLQEARTLDPVQQAREQLSADVRILGTITPGAYQSYQQYQAAYIQQQAKVAQDQRSITEQIVGTRMSTLQYELHTQQITGQQYILGLQQLLKMHGLANQEVQQIRSAIFDEAHAQAVNLNVGNIRLPTSYEVRRSIRAAMRAGARIPQNTGTVVNHHVVNHVTMQIRVDKNADLKPFADTLDNTLKSNFTGQAQAAGLI